MSSSTQLFGRNVCEITRVPGALRRPTNQLADPPPTRQSERLGVHRPIDGLSKFGNIGEHCFGGLCASCWSTDRAVFLIEKKSADVSPRSLPEADRSVDSHGRDGPLCAKLGVFAILLQESGQGAEALSSCCCCSSIPASIAAGKRMRTTWIRVRSDGRIIGRTTWDSRKPVPPSRV